MTTYARIEGGLVAEMFTTEGDITQLFSPALVWVNVAGQTPVEGWSYAGGVFAVPVPPPAPTFAELKAIELADFRAKREMFLNRVAGIGFAAQETGDTVTVQASMSVRQGLLDLPSSAPVQAATDLPTLHAAIRAQYAAVVGAVPDSAKAAFAKVDA